MKRFAVACLLVAIASGVAFGVKTVNSRQVPTSDDFAAYGEPQKWAQYDSLLTEFANTLSSTRGAEVIDVKRVNCDTLRGNVNVDSLYGLTIISGNPSIDSISGLAVLRGNPNMDSAVINVISGLNSLSGNPKVDSLDGIIEIDSVQIAAIATNNASDPYVTELDTAASSDTLKITIGGKTLYIAKNR